MLSPHTPPGTKVICINAGELNGLRVWSIAGGQTYTVYKINIEPTFKAGFSVTLVEVADEGESGFQLERFRRSTQLPQSISKILSEDIPPDLKKEVEDEKEKQKDKQREPEKVR